METILHRIKAYLYHNSLNSDPDTYIARISSERSLDIAEICDSAVDRGGADISSTLMQHGVNLFLKEMAYQLCDGYSVNTGYFKARPHIKGVFNSTDEAFDPERHRVLFRLEQGKKLRDGLSSVEVEITGMADTSLSIFQVTDIKTGSVNDLLSPNRNLSIKGRKIKVAGDNEEAGVYFVNQVSGESIPVDPSDLIINKPSELIIVIPDLKAGTYQLQVTTRFNKHTLLKNPQTVVFDKMLTVQ